MHRKDVIRALAGPKPGSGAHIEMASSYRPGPPPPSGDVRKAAVLVLLYQHEDEVRLMLTLRPKDLRHHGGQVAFPGGGKESGDASLLETALRETKEELGAEISLDDIVGQLSPLYIRPSNNLAHPYVAFCSKRPSISPDPSEVEEVIDVKLDDLLDERNIKVQMMTIGEKEQPVRYYDLNGFKVWGATAMMLSELRAVLTSLGLGTVYRVR